MGVVHEITSGVVGDDFPVVQGNPHFNQVGIAGNGISGAVLFQPGKVKGAHPIGSDVVALLDGFHPGGLGEKFFGLFQGLLLGEFVFTDFPGIGNRAQQPTVLGDGNPGIPVGEVIAGQAAAGIGGVLQTVRLYSQKFGRSLLRVALGQTLQLAGGLGSALADVVAEGAVIDEGRGIPQRPKRSLPADR